MLSGQNEDTQGNCAISGQIIRFKWFKAVMVIYGGNMGMELTLYYVSNGKFGYGSVFYVEADYTWLIVLSAGFIEDVYSYNGFLTEC